MCSVVDAANGRFGGRVPSASEVLCQGHRDALSAFATGLYWTAAGADSDSAADAGKEGTRVQESGQVTTIGTGEGFIQTYLLRMKHEASDFGFGSVFGFNFNGSR